MVVEATMPYILVKAGRAVARRVEYEGKWFYFVGIDGSRRTFQTRDESEQLVIDGAELFHIAAGGLA